MFLGQVSLVRDGGRGVAAESLDVKNGKEEPVFHRFCKIQHNPDEQGETAQERLRSNQPCGVVWSLALALKRFFSSAFRNCTQILVDMISSPVHLQEDRPDRAFPNSSGLLRPTVHIRG